MIEGTISKDIPQNLSADNPASQNTASPLWLVIIASLLMIQIPSLLILLSNYLLSQNPLALSALGHLSHIIIYIVSPVLIIWMIKQQMRCNLSTALSTLGLIQKPTLNVILISIAIGILTTFSAIALTVFVETSIEANTMQLLKTHASLIGMLSLCFIVMFATPVIEEIVFRGWFYEIASKGRLGSWGAALLIATLFTLLHLNPNIQAISLLSIFSVGMICAWLRYRYESLWPAIAMHVSFNASQLMSVLLATS